MMPLLDRAPRPAIPTEVVERIIDIVAEPVDRADGVRLKARADTLYACTLVAQSWMPRSRVHLYRDVVLSSDWRTRRFLNSLTLSPPLGQYVEILRIWPRNDDEMTCGWIFKALSTLPPLLPHLRELALCHLPDLRQECIVILSRFSTVESLVLFDVKQSLREVVLLISRFPHLRRLYVDRGNWELPGRCFSRKKHNLTTLHVVASPPDCERSLLEWALASKSTGALTSIRARCDDSGSAMDRVLQTCCSTFQELYLEFYGTSTEVPSLTNFPKLHRLALFGFTNEVIPVLGRLPLFAPSSLVGIFVYTYSATQDDEVPESEWKAVDLALCAAKFNHLKCVEFHALNDQPLQNPHAYFRQALPTCYQRGILWYRPYRQGPYIHIASEGATQDTGIPLEWEELYR